MSDRTHQRKAIRSAAVTLLKTVVTGVSNRVYPARKDPVESEKLPCILVYTTTETAEQLDWNNTKRVVSLSVEIQADGPDEITVTEALDALASKVEECFLDNEQLNGTAHMVSLTRSQEAIEDEGSKIVGGVKLDYDVVYFTESVKTAPSDGLDTVYGNINGLGSTNDLTGV